MSSPDLALHGSGVPINDHAITRMRQRGIRADILAFVLDHADRFLPRRNGTEAWAISRRELVRLRRLGTPAPLVERAARLQVVVSFDGVALTVFRDGQETGPQASGGRYDRA